VFRRGDKKDQRDNVSQPRKLDMYSYVSVVEAAKGMYMQTNVMSCAAVSMVMGGVT